MQDKQTMFLYTRVCWKNSNCILPRDCFAVAIFTKFIHSDRRASSQKSSPQRDNHKLAAELFKKSRSV